MDNLTDGLANVIASLIIVVFLIFLVCLGWGIPFSFSKAVGIWAGIALISIAKCMIFD